MYTYNLDALTLGLISSKWCAWRWPVSSYLCPRSAPSRSTGCPRQVHHGLWQVSSQSRTRPCPGFTTTILVVATRQLSGITALRIDPPVSSGRTGFGDVRPRSALILVDAGLFRQSCERRSLDDSDDDVSIFGHFLVLLVYE